MLEREVGLAFGTCLVVSRLCSCHFPVPADGLWMGRERK